MPMPPVIPAPTVVVTDAALLMVMATAAPSLGLWLASPA